MRAARSRASGSIALSTACASMASASPRLKLRREVWTPSVAATTDEWQGVLNQARREYVERGFCHIPNFLSTKECASMCAEYTEARDEGEFFLSSETHTVYQEENDESLPSSHCRNVPVVSSKCIVDYARVPDSSILKAIYKSPRLLELVQQTTGTSELHLSACPYNAAYFNEFSIGDGLGWHFDRSEFGVNLVLQPPGTGAEFEFHHNTRTEEDLDSYCKVEDILARGSDHHEVDCVDYLGVGSLVIFSGRLSMHRVKPLLGPPTRINAILTYEKEEGQAPKAYTLRKFFGR